MNEKLANMVAIFKVAKGEKLIQHTPALSKAVLASLLSPLAMGHCRQLWGVLCHSVFKQWTLGKKKKKKKKKSVVGGGVQIDWTRPDNDKSAFLKEIVCVLCI